MFAPEEVENLLSKAWTEVLDTAVERGGILEGDEDSAYEVFTGHFPVSDFIQHSHKAGKGLVKFLLMFVYKMEGRHCCFSVMVAKWTMGVSE